VIIVRGRRPEAGRLEQRFIIPHKPNANDSVCLGEAAINHLLADAEIIIREQVAIHPDATGRVMILNPGLIVHLPGVEQPEAAHKN